MNFIIFGSGRTGQIAFLRLSPARIAYYADNNRFGESLFGKSVISYGEMIDIYKKDERIIVVIASEKYWKEMEEQVQASGIERYFIFHERDVDIINDILPFYYLYRSKISVPYVRLLLRWQIIQYKNIIIYGVNFLLPYLLLEIMEQNSSASISIIPQLGYDGDIYSLGYPVIQSYKFSKKESKKIDCVIFNVRRNEDDIRDQNISLDSHVKILDIYDISDMEPLLCHRELTKYKDLHKGKRIFIIGNGPSLRFDDLDKLHEHGEICIAFNKIYRAYAKTKWRADYIGFSDNRVIEQCKEDILKIPGKVFVADRYHFGGNSYMDGVQYFHEFLEDYYPNYPGFSDDFTKGFYNGMTIAYDMGIQLAAYMGASEIFLLGVDNAIVGNLTDNCNHFLEEYYLKGEKDVYEGVIFEKEKIVKAYEKAELYSKQQGFRIYNATRGGALEVFERVDFDSLF